MFITIRDVAAAADVSIATASRALSGRRPVLPAHKRAVVEASERLGYRPNGVARALRMRETATVGMVVPRISNPYFPLLVEAVERELSGTGRELLLCDSQNDVAIEAARVNALLGRRIDGLLFINCHRRDSVETFTRARAQVPVVQVDRHVNGQKADFVGVNNEAGMLKMVQHLSGVGCRTFAFVGSKPVDSTGVLRLRGYRKAVREFDPPSASRVLLDEYSISWGTEAGRMLLAERTLPDAILCGADIIALGVIATLAGCGVRVPDDVSVTGFDDIAFAAISTPPLTTLRQPAEAIGAEAVRMLGERIANSGCAPREKTFPPELQVRKSAVAAPAPV